jgi:hypothetical protein
MYGFAAPRFTARNFSRARACSRDVPVSRPSFCEVEVNHTLIVPEFDPESQPISYSAALEFSGEGGYADSHEE